MVIGVIPKRITVVDRQNALTSGLFQVTTPYFYDPINGTIQPVGLVTQVSSLRGPLYNFDGSSSLRYVNDRKLTPPFTVAFDVIFRTVGFDVFQVMVSQGGVGVTNGFKVAIASNGIRVTFGGVADYFISNSTVANTLYRVCVTVSGNGGTAIAYKNGASVGSVAVGTMATPASTGTVIGADPVSFVLSGTRIGNVALWNRALSADEVLLLNNSSLLSTQPRYVQTDSTPSPTSRTFFVPRRKVMSTQPTSSVAIDWGSPLARGLVTAYVPSDRNPARELVTGANDSATTRLSVGAGLRGVRGFNTGASTPWSLNFGWATRWPHPYGLILPFPALTVFALYEQYDTTTDGAVFGGGPNGTNYARFVKANDGSVVFVSSTNTAGGNISSPVLNTNQVYTLVGVNEGSYRELFIDGNSVASANTTITFINSTYTYAGAGYITNQFRRMGLYCGYVWTRRLTTPEIQSISGNPWQIFKQPRLSPALAEDGKVYAPFMS